MLLGLVKQRRVYLWRRSTVLMLALSEVTNSATPKVRKLLFLKLPNTVKTPRPLNWFDL